MPDQPKVEPKMFEFGGADDYQLHEAVNYLDGRPVKRRDPTLVLAPEAKGKAKAKQKGKTEQQPTESVEKKTLLNNDKSHVEHYRVTPNGVIRVH
jgi:carboxyl-terminal processing protease